MSLTASIPDELSASWMSARIRSGVVFARERHGLVAGAGDAGDLVAKFLDDGLQVHRDDRLVLDDHHPAGHRMRHLVHRDVLQLLRLGEIDLHDLADLDCR